MFSENTVRQTVSDAKEHSNLPIEFQEKKRKEKKSQVGYY